MSHQVPMAFVSKYRADATMLIQQRQSRFEPTVGITSQTAQYEFHEQIGPVSAAPWGPRHGDTPLMETPHLRRRVGIFPYVWADLIDRPDRIRMLIDPTGPYTTNAVMAFNRRKDDIIIAAALGNAYTGHEGETVVALPASQKFVGAGFADKPITVELLTEIKTKFWNNDLDEEEQLTMAVSPDSIRSLLMDERVSSADFNTVRALVRGDVDEFMGFKFVRTTRLPVRPVNEADLTKGFIRTNLVWARGGLLLSKGQDIQVEVTPRPDKKYSTQVFVSMDLGASRMEEKKVVAFETFEKTAAPTPAP